MNCYRCTGRDVHVGAQREWWVIARDAQEAARFSLQRGLNAERLEQAVESERPADVLMMRVPEPAPEEPALRRRVRLLLLGLLLGLVVILGILFTLKAREHLGRGRPPMQHVP
jgi:uncharacterized protein involved in exopolysaccharide biosynthesis